MMLDTSNQQGIAPCNTTRELDDDYAKVVYQLGKWRVIECKDSIQWIIQRTANLSCLKSHWKPISYCTTRKALIRVWHAKTGDYHGDVELSRLPERIGGHADGK